MMGFETGGRTRSCGDMLQEWRCACTCSDIYSCCRSKLAKWQVELGVQALIPKEKVYVLLLHAKVEIGRFQVTITSLVVSNFFQILESFD
jgi:hypothetical protein